MTAIVFKPSYEAYLIEAHGLSVDDSFPTQAAKKECLRLLSRAYEAITSMKSYQALEEAGLSVFDIPLHLHNVRRAKHFDLFCVAVGNEWAGRVFYLYNERERIKAMPIRRQIKGMGWDAYPKTPKTERSATHAGSCQICGRMHKVDVKTGRIASHGYVRGFGGNYSACEGSHRRPFETHSDALVRYIKRLEKKWAFVSDKVPTLTGYERMSKEREERALIAAINSAEERLATWVGNQPLTPVEELV